MLNKRIIFALLYKDGFFHLSRNFRLQKVGDVNWLINNFGFGETCDFIDELVCILVKKDPSIRDKIDFLKQMEIIRQKFFVPITLGGGIKSLNDAKSYFLNGADKILINSKSSDTKFLKKISDLWGEQSITIMIDYQKDLNLKNNLNVYIDCGSNKLMTLTEFKNKILKNIPCGEIILNSMDNDGNGAGLDLNISKKFNNDFKSPLLLMGGAGKPEHIAEGLKIKNISGVVTANLFNFLGSGLEKSREVSMNNGINLAKFENKIQL